MYGILLEKEDSLETLQKTPVIDGLYVCWYINKCNIYTYIYAMKQKACTKIIYVLLLFWFCGRFKITFC